MPSPLSLNAEQRALREVCAPLAGTHSRQQIAALLNLRVHTVTVAMRGLPKFVNQTVPAERRDEILRAIWPDRMHENRDLLAQEFGVSRSAIYRWLEEFQQARGWHPQAPGWARELWTELSGEDDAPAQWVNEHRAPHLALPGKCSGWDA